MELLQLLFILVMFRYALCDCWWLHCKCPKYDCETKLKSVWKCLTAKLKIGITFRTDTNQILSERFWKHILIIWLTFKILKQRAILKGIRKWTLLLRDQEHSKFQKTFFDTYSLKVPYFSTHKPLPPQISPPFRNTCVTPRISPPARARTRVDFDFWAREVRFQVQIFLKV